MFLCAISAREDDFNSHIHDRVFGARRPQEGITRLMARAISVAKGGAIEINRQRGEGGGLMRNGTVQPRLDPNRPVPLGKAIGM